MKHDMDDHLTPKERAAFEALPRERTPSRLLEQRTVKALRVRGVLQPKWHVSLPGWVAAGLAASVALFASGIAVGQLMASRSTQEMVLAMNAQSAMQVATAVQRTGSEYTAALERLVALSDSGEQGSDLAQGREVALTALWTAADQIVRIMPDDPIATRIVQAFEFMIESDSATAGEMRRVAWF